MNSSTKLIANFIKYIFCVSIQRITQSVPIMVSCLGNLWWQYQYHTNCYNILVFLSYDLWIYCQYFQMNFKQIHTYLLLFSTQWCFLQHQSVLRASGNHFIYKNSWFVFSEIRFVLLLNLNCFHRHLVSNVKVLH